MNKLFFKEKKSWLFKNTSFIVGVMFILQLILSGTFFVEVNEVQAISNNKMCSTAVDVVLAMDRSGSMASEQVTEHCVWWEIVSNDSGGYEWVQNTTYNVDQAWCDAKSQPPTRLSVYTPGSVSKMDKAKDAANSFLNLMGGSDQSGLVYFSYDETPSDPNNDPWIAFLDKKLSSDHGLTSTRVDALNPDGPTNIGDAIDLANKELVSSRANNQAVKAMILLTDGVPNMPSDTGNNNSLDVQYALDKAGESANQNIKVFTIGLGSEINTGLLTDIATLTGAKYYPAPNSDDLEEIYNSIALDLCQYGSISGCKYNAINDEPLTDGVDSTWTKLDDWEIVLDDGVDTKSQVTVDGCYSFAGLNDGIYTVSEILTGNWIQTFPTGGSHSVKIYEHKDAVNIDFANFLPSTPVTGSISGYNYNDLNNNGLIDDGGAINPDWEMQLIKCPYSPMSEGASMFADKTAIDISGDPLPGACRIFSTTTTDSLGYYEFTNLVAGDYGVSEADKAAWAQTYPLDNQFYYLNLMAGAATTTINFANYNQPAPVCGDGIVNQSSEQCDDGNITSGDGCSSTCSTEGGGGGSICGDGALDSNEQCDDGNTISGDGCSSTCNTEGGGGGSICGDGALDSNEQCDDGNTTSGDGCSSTCNTEGGGGRVINYCGDGIWQSPNTSSTGGPLNDGYEECDGTHNVPDGFDCNANCELKPIIVLGAIGPELSIVKTIDREVASPGDKNIEYRITVENIDPVMAEQVMLVDTLPEGLVYSGVASNTRTWDLGDIPPFEKRTVAFLVDVKEDAEAGTFPNIAQVSATNVDPKEASADLKIEVVKVLGVELVPTGFEINELLISLFILLLLFITSFKLRKRLGTK